MTSLVVTIQWIFFCYHHQTLVMFQINFVVLAGGVVVVVVAVVVVTVDFTVVDSKPNLL